MQLDFFTKLTAVAKRAFRPTPAPQRPPPAHADPWQQKAVSGLVIIFVTFLLYRKIDSIGKIGVLLWTGVILTLGWILIFGQL